MGWRMKYIYVFLNEFMLTFDHFAAMVMILNLISLCFLSLSLSTNRWRAHKNKLYLFSHSPLYFSSLSWWSSPALLSHSNSSQFLHLKGAVFCCCYFLCVLYTTFLWYIFENKERKHFMCWEMLIFECVLCLNWIRIAYSFALFSVSLSLSLSPHQNPLPLKWSEKARIEWKDFITNFVGEFLNFFTQMRVFL